MEGLTAIIGGTGLSRIDGLTIKRMQSVDTPYGEPSSPLMEGSVNGNPVVFLARHGNPHRIPPHLVNYRANIWALHYLKAKRIIAINAVGGISSALNLAELVIVDQIIDYSYGRAHTFFEDQATHVDFTHPFDETLREAIIRSAQTMANEEAEFRFSDRGTYGCTQGPRLESAAEIARMSRDGCDVVGMTGMPEAVLARELGLPYAAISMVVNMAAGIAGDLVTMDAIDESANHATRLLERLLAAS